MNLYNFKLEPTLQRCGLFFEAADLAEASTKVPKLIDIWFDLELKAWKEGKELTEAQLKVWEQRKAAKETRPDEYKPRWDWKEPEKTDSAYRGFNVTFLGKKEEV